ncbi:hypothetical protein [Sporosarcina aquimarina]|uniref:hypothetical protein n=1 Tax=Sporosarcina aquimarina TaxID=114975 RepID=UPI00203B8F74|nr:hypothetical protein [Sporosarcina aquimarina]
MLDLERNWGDISGYVREEKEARILRRVKEELETDDAYFRRDYSMGGACRRTYAGYDRFKGTCRNIDCEIRHKRIQTFNQGATEVSLVFGVHKKERIRIISQSEFALLRCLSDIDLQESFVLIKILIISSYKCFTMSPV